MGDKSNISHEPSRYLCIQIHRDMFGKGSKIYSITQSKCPACHEGDIFESAHAYDLKNMSKTYTHCSECGQAYEPEPNFFYGAMYVSYAYAVALFVAIYIIGAVFLGLGMWPIIGLLLGSLVVLAPLLFRLSRVTWMNIFIHYKEGSASK